AGVDHHRHWRRGRGRELVALRTAPRDVPNQDGGGRSTRLLRQGMWMLKRLTCLGLAAGVIAACADEDPVGIDDLVPDDAVRTYEVVLDAPAFLAATSSATGFVRPAVSGFAVVAE